LSDRKEARPTILIIEDEPEIRLFLRTSLSVEGYRIAESTTGRRGLIDAGTHKPDLAIVDLGLPDVDGLEVIRRIREWSSMPIVVLSARAQERSKIEALDAGANDYVTKPFGIGELLARVRAALRYMIRPGSGKQVLRLSGAIVDFERRVASRDGAEVRLTPIEFRLLAVLAKNLGMVVTHRQLLAEVWGPTHQSDTHYLRVYMKQLREKLEADPVRPRHLVTDTGVGYRLLVDE
jgi:two-component system, OmpR family, KDP operon response regulator KdpE